MRSPTVSCSCDRDNPKTNREIPLNQGRNCSCNEVETARLRKIKGKDCVEQVASDIRKLAGIHRLEQLQRVFEDKIRSRGEALTP